jgi:hypothetical protein
MKWPLPVISEEHKRAIARIVARSSLLPHQETVAAFSSAIFPSCRRKSDKQIAQTMILPDGRQGIYDNNATPTWAICWAHGIQGERPKGWTVAHIWSAAEDIDCYTHLANIALVPEALSTTTDKSGPLTQYLRWHSFQIYGWKPEGSEIPTEPKDYNEIKWCYLERIENPHEEIRRNFTRSRDKRVKALRGIGYSPPMVAG